MSNQPSESQDVNRTCDTNAAQDGCYICQPENPAAAEEGCSTCDREFWAYAARVSEALS